MKQTHALIAAGILVVLVAIAGIVTMIKRPAPDKAGYDGNGISRPMPVPPKDGVPSDPNAPAPSVTTIVATKEYINGSFHVEGTLTLPTPCHQLIIDQRVMESYPEQVVVDFTIRDSGNICVQVLHEQAWEFDVRVSPQATFTATLNGQPAVFDWGSK